MLVRFCIFLSLIKKRKQKNESFGDPNLGRNKNIFIYIHCKPLFFFRTKINSTQIFLKNFLLLQKCATFYPSSYT